jgi:hypothetical protein
MRGETRIEAYAGHHDAETIGTDQPHSIFLRGAPGLGQRPRAMTKTGGDDESARRAQSACLLDETCDCRRRRGNHHEFGHKWQFAEARDGGNAVDLGVMRIHQAKLAFELRPVNIPENGPPD